MKENIRNFSIVAHIDHGKSTLADRLLEMTGSVTKREMQDQLLDQMDLEREKGITIKLAPVTMEHTTASGEKYVFNLIDTPGHVDFTYEVSRSLACCEGVLLLVDATQGMQAQTLSNLYLALEHDLEIIPVINKIDLPNANVEAAMKEIEHVIGVPADDVIAISAKTGEGVDKLIDIIIEKVPPPNIPEKPSQALIFDSVYDSFQGVVAYARVFSGELKPGDKVNLLATNTTIQVLETGIFKPKRVKTEKLESGNVGYIVTGLKSVKECKVGDTISDPRETTPLPGYKKVQPMVFASFYPVDASDFPACKEALEKLTLNDSALTFDLENSPALGRGFRCGFLGLLHLEIIQERLKREFDLNLIITVPTVTYSVDLTDGSNVTIFNPAELPDPSSIQDIKEPWSTVDIITPKDYIGSIMELIENYRGDYKNTEYLDSDRAILKYEMPLASIISDFYDKLKSVSSGYASLNYELIKEFRISDLVRLDILIAEEKVDALARIVPKDEAYSEGKKIVKALKEELPKKSFAIALQAAIGSKIIARETIRALRKDVTAKLYGGDITRKRKLLEKQKKGKKKMKQIGKVDIPQEAFLAILKK